MEQKHVQRLIGIDFGTSTSLIRVKRYQGQQPIGDSYSVGAVTYGNGAGDSKAVTLVRHNGDSTFTCGRYGEEQVGGSTIYREFKMDLESPDARRQNLAKELTSEFFKYLYARYEHQQSDLGQISDEVRTIISYPVKWKQETRDFMEAVAVQAGFPNVSSMDEPSAALYAVLCRKMDELIQQQLLTAGQSGYVLLVDMGAGTTDLAVCRYQISAEGALTAADRIKTQIVATWPPHTSSLTFGGREVDRILEDYLIDYLRSCGFGDQIAERAIRGVPGVKAWKEDTVSTVLAKDQRVTACSLATQYLMLAAQPKPFPAFGREEFQQLLKTGMEEFQQLVTECLTNAAEQEEALSARGIDLVVLTGGHSSWYFTSELLDGTMPGLEHPALEKVQREKNRVLRLSNPQETVALGMVYSQLPFHIEKAENLAPPQEAEEGPESIEEELPEEIPEELRNHIGSEPSEQEEAGGQTIGQFICTYPLTVIAPANESVRSQLMQNLGVPGGVAVFRAYDSTIFGFGKYGTVFTEAGIYSRSMLAAPSFCSWKDFADGLLRFSAGNVYSHSKSTHVEKQVGSFATMGEDVKTFYRQLALCARRFFSQGDVLREEVAKNANICYEAVLSSFLAGFDSGILSQIAGKCEPAAMRAVFNIPQEEQVYLAHDDTWLTWFHTAATGTVLTGRGIYTKVDNGVVRFVSWPEFAAGTIEPQSNDFMLTCPNGERKLAGRFALCRAQAITLYLELQNAFRSAAAQVRERGEATPKEEKSTPVEDFLKCFDWSGMADILSAREIPFVQQEAGPHIGKVYLAHRSYLDGANGRTWFWFAIGERGIYTSEKKGITWGEFLAGDVVLRENFKQDIPVSGFPVRVLYEANVIHCFVAGLYIPSSNTMSQTVLCVFFAELKKYLQDPGHYRVEREAWTGQRKQALVDFVSRNPGGGMLRPYDGNSLLLEFLNCPASSKPLLQCHNGNLNSVYACASCVDEEGFRRRIYKAGQVSITNHAAFLSNPIWAMANAAGGIFFAGTHLLFDAVGNLGQVEQTLGYLKALQNQLKNAK